MLLDGSPDVVGDVLKRKKITLHKLYGPVERYFFCRSLKVIRIVRQP